MSDVPKTPTPDRAFLRIELPGPHGTALGLRAGDIITAVNGIPLHGNEAHFRARFGKTPGRVCALNLLRGERCFTVLSGRPDVGQLVVIDPSAEQLRTVERGRTGRLYPDHMVNWEVYLNRAGQYDLQPLKPSVLALVAAPLWLAQMRLWAALAMMVGVVVIAIPVGWIMAAALYALASLYVWHAGAAVFRADRMAAGFKAHAVVAAAHEAGAHREFAALEPRARFVYAPQPDPVTEDGEAPAYAYATSRVD